MITATFFPSDEIDFMKNLVWAIAAFFASSVANITAQTASASATTTNAAQATAASRTAPVRLSYGVPEILNLSRAQVGDGIIIAYIGNSDTIYNLSSAEIVYLKGQGVSDPVLSAMLQQSQKLAKSTPQLQAAESFTPASAGEAVSVAQPAPAYSAPAPTYVQPAPEYVPSSTVYVIPNPPSKTYYVPGFYPYYGGYYGYPYSGVSFGFSFGGGHYHGGYHGVWAGGHGGHH